MGLVIGFIWMVIGYVLMQTSIQVWAALMLPNPVERARQRIERTPAVCFFIGLGVAIATLVITAPLFKGPGPLQLLAWVVMSPALLAAVVGGAAFARILGARLRKQMRNDSEIASLVFGALTTAIAGLLPIVGWFMFLPLVGLTSIGSGVLGLLSKRRVAEDPAPQPQPAQLPTGYPYGQAAQTLPAQPTYTYPSVENPSGVA